VIRRAPPKSSATSTPQAAPALMNTLADEDAEVRVASLRALAHARAAPALLDVAACLSDSEPEVRVKAVETLVNWPEAHMA
jgi:HEAT repeat protein